MAVRVDWGAVTMYSRSLRVLEHMTRKNVAGQKRPTLHYSPGLHLRQGLMIAAGLQPSVRVSLKL
jgi:hypothetical protein